MKRWLVRHVAFPIKEAARGQRSQRVLAEILRTQWLPRDVHRSNQLAALQRQIAHAYENVPFYRQWLEKAGALPSDIQSFDDYARLPAVTKQEYAQAGQALVARGFEKDVYFSRTSGSTGAPTLVPVSRSSGSTSLAHAWRGRGWWGIGIGDREFKFWGRSATFERTRRGAALARAKLVKDRLLNVRSVSPFDMSEEALEGLARLYARDKPALVFGYGHAILLFAEYLSQKRRAVERWRPRAVIYTSEYLQPSQREFISSVFGAPIASEYGAVECGIIAYDAPCGSMHASDEALYLEHSGSPSTLLVSNLGAWSTPLLRYELGDLVVLGDAKTSCNCGRGLSLVRAMVGRNNDLIVKPTGEPVHAELFDYAMRHQPGVRRYRIVQNDVASLEILLQMREPADGAVLQREIVDRLRPFLGDELRVSVTQVEELRPLPSGKFQWVVSNVRRRPDPAASR